MSKSVKKIVCLLVALMLLVSVAFQEEIASPEITIGENAEDEVLQEIVELQEDETEATEITEAADPMPAEEAEAEPVFEEEAETEDEAEEIPEAAEEETADEEAEESEADEIEAEESEAETDEVKIAADDGAEIAVAVFELTADRYAVAPGEEVTVKVNLKAENADDTKIGYFVVRILVNGLYQSSRAVKGATIREGVLMIDEEEVTFESAFVAMTNDTDAVTVKAELYVVNADETERVLAYSVVILNRAEEAVTEEIDETADETEEAVTEGTEEVVTEETVTEETEEVVTEETEEVATEETVTEETKEVVTEETQEVVTEETEEVVTEETEEVGQEKTENNADEEEALVKAEMTKIENNEEQPEELISVAMVLGTAKLETVSLYSAPNENANAITTLAKGDMIGLYNVQDGWAKIITADDLIGYIPTGEIALYMSQNMEQIAEGEKIRSVSFYSDHQTQITLIGEEVTLYAVLTGFEEDEYIITWQYTPDNGETVFDAPNGNGLTYRVITTEENAGYLWRLRVELIDTEATDLSEVME